MLKELTRERLEPILEAEHLEDLSFEEIRERFFADKTMADFMPDGVCEIDPRNGSRIIFNAARAMRPKDNDRSKDAAAGPKRAVKKECIICEGKTTGVLDVAPLSNGFTFINKNLFPIVYPLEAPAQWLLKDPEDKRFKPRGLMSHGFHFLQWTSSVHDDDWHTLPPGDCTVAMGRLAALEKTLLTGFGPRMFPADERQPDAGRRGFVSIIKNYGKLVGGSLAHGHQQIIFNNIMPRSFNDDWAFENERNEPFTAYMLRENPFEFLVRDYGSAVLMVPFFMRRPYDMLLMVKDTDKTYLHDLDEKELADVAHGWHDATRAIHHIMPRIGREIAYNITSHNGPGRGLYFEFLPYTQETGGFEHIGLFSCQGKPHDVAMYLRNVLSDRGSLPHKEKK